MPIVQIPEKNLTLQFPEGMSEEEMRKEFRGPITTIRGLNQAVKAEMERRKLTPIERARIRGFASKVGLGFSLSIGESPED